MLGLSFKAGTDDLSPLVYLVKRLLGKAQIQIWDNNVMLGRLVGSNRQFIDEFIPHIGQLHKMISKPLSIRLNSFWWGPGLDRQTLRSAIREDQTIVTSST